MKFLCRMLLSGKFIIDFSPKAGCTTIVKMVFGALGILEEALDYDPWVHTYRADKFYEKFGRVTEDMLSSDKFVKMKFVRNPYFRSASAYLSIHLNAVRHNHKVDGELIDVSFLEFLNLIKEEKLVLIENDHYKSQYREYWESKFKFDEIIHLDNLDKEVSRLNKKYNLNFKIDSYSRHHHEKDETWQEFVGTTKYREIDVRDNCVPTYENFYNSEIKDLVYELYKNDFEKYGYDKDCKV